MYRVIVKTGESRLGLVTNESSLSVNDLQSYIQDKEALPVEEQKLWANGKLLLSNQLISLESHLHHPLMIDVHLDVLGGKGGFGSLLRGGQAGVMQKKTTNFNACRNLEGRRIRHVKQEAALAEWSSKKEKNPTKPKKTEKRKELGTFNDSQFNEENELVTTMVSEAVSEVLSGSLLSKRQRSAKDQSPTPKRIKGDLFDSIDEDEDGDLDNHPRNSKNEDLSPENPILDGEVDQKVNLSPESGSEPDKEDDLDWDKYSSAESLQQLGLVGLKNELQKRGLLCGGNLEQRAQRLFSIRGKPKSEWDDSIIARKRTQKKSKKSKKTSKPK